MPKGKTKQGVRDLNSLPVKKNTRRMDGIPSIAEVCRHPSAQMRRLPNGDTSCAGCGQCFDWNGNPY